MEITLASTPSLDLMIETLKAFWLGGEYDFLTSGNDYLIIKDGKMIEGCHIRKKGKRYYFIKE